MAQEADYVIVGGGTSGLVVAHRLSEDPNVSVIVLEAGEDLRADPLEIPDNPSEPQGKMLGGSSGINGQTFVPPSVSTIDSWSKLGNSTWTHDALLPYFMKSYTLHLPDGKTQTHLRLDWVDHSIQGESGPLQVSFPADLQSPLAKAWIDAFNSIGYNATADPHSGKAIGAFNNLATVDPRTRTRSYAASAYGTPALQRPNVRILTGTVVERVVLDSSGPSVKAIGANAFVRGQEHTFMALKEVILAAGAINTPKLLELSGIGNSKILNEHGITPVIENPNVGENLQDHLMSGLSFEVVDGVVTGDALLRQEPEALSAAMKMYADDLAGPLTIGGVQSSAFMPMLEFDGPDGEKRQKEFFDRFLPADKTSSYHNIVRSLMDQPKETSCQMFMFLAQANLHSNPKIGSFVGNELQSGSFLSMGVIQCVPFSRGYTHISSSDAKDEPTIDPKFFSHPLDIEIMARNLLDVERMHSVKPLDEYIKPQGRRNHPDAFLTDIESAKKYLRDTASTAFHSCGTAAMLPRDEGGVVDEKLRVYGTSNLRIVDASIFPVIPGSNLMTTTYAVAERAADIIKSEAS
ncbi:Oxygen-dependent choline dehydrogenase [Talaromyces pinophilus]|nr:Oxygen-dependent choline dehydrogenase [Talaromyces pinophilus]